MSYCSRSCRRRFTVSDFKVDHIVSFTTVFSNTCTAHAQKRLFMNFRCKLRHRRSICRPRFPTRVRNFGDLATFSVDICIYMLNVLHISTSGLFDLLTEKVYHTRWPHVDNFHQVWSWYDHTMPSYSVFVCWYVTWPCDRDLWPFDLEQLSYMAGQRDQPCHQVWRPCAYPLLSYEL